MTGCCRRADSKDTTCTMQGVVGLYQLFVAGCSASSVSAPRFPVKFWSYLLLLGQFNSEHCDPRATHSRWNSYPKALRTHITRFSVQKTTLYRAVGLFRALESVRTNQLSSTFRGHGHGCTRRAGRAVFAGCHGGPICQSSSGFDLSGFAGPAMAFGTNLRLI